MVFFRLLKQNQAKFRQMNNYKEIRNLKSKQERVYTSLIYIYSQKKKRNVWHSNCALRQRPEIVFKLTFSSNITYKVVWHMWLNNSKT